MNNKWLTMNVYINAWLDCNNPYLSINNKFDDDVLAHFNSEKLDQLILDGELTVAELQSTDPSIQMNIITDLIAIQTGETIRKQIVELSHQLKKRGKNKEKNHRMNIIDFVSTPNLVQNEQLV